MAVSTATALADDFVGVEAGPEQSASGAPRRVEAIWPAATESQRCTAAAAAGFWQPVGAPELLGEIDEDGVGIRDHKAIVFQDGHLTEAVQLEELRRLVRALRQIDLDQVEVGLDQDRNSLARCACPESGWK